MNSYTNPRGIPRAPFVGKVEEFVTSPEDINGTLRKFDEMLSCAPSTAQLTQKIQIHGSQSNKTITTSPQFNTRHAKNSRHGKISRFKKG